MSRDPGVWARTTAGYDSNVYLEYLIILYFTYLVTYLFYLLYLLPYLLTYLLSFFTYFNLQSLGIFTDSLNFADSIFCWLDQD